MSTLPSPFRSAAELKLLNPAADPKAAPSAETSPMSTLPSWFKSGFFVRMQLVELVAVLTLQLVASVRNARTMLAELLLEKLTLIGMVIENKLCPVELTIAIVIKPVKVLAVVSTVSVPETEAVISLNETVLEKVMVCVVAWAGARTASISSVEARIGVLNMFIMFIQLSKEI
jgi:hypothetical protein